MMFSHSNGCRMYIYKQFTYFIINSFKSWSPKKQRYLKNFNFITKDEDRVLLHNNITSTCHFYGLYLYGKKKVELLFLEALNNR